MAATVAGTGAAPFHVEAIGEHRGIPIYHLAYDRPTVLDRAVHEMELKTLAAIRTDRFALVLSYRNLSTAPAYGPEAQSEIFRSPPVQALTSRLVAVARYSPGSFTTMIRIMAAHLGLRRPMSSGFAPDMETALVQVRRGIEESLDPRP